MVVKRRIFCIRPNIGPYDHTTNQKAVCLRPKPYTWQHWTNLAPISDSLVPGLNWELKVRKNHLWFAVQFQAPSDVERQGQAYTHFLRRIFAIYLIFNRIFPIRRSCMQFPWILISLVLYLFDWHYEISFVRKKFPSNNPPLDSEILQFCRPKISTHNCFCAKSNDGILLRSLFLRLPIHFSYFAFRAYFTRISCFINVAKNKPRNSLTFCANDEPDAKCVKRKKGRKMRKKWRKILRYTLFVFHIYRDKCIASLTKNVQWKH